MMVGVATLELARTNAGVGEGGTALELIEEARAILTESEAPHSMWLASASLYEAAARRALGEDDRACAALGEAQRVVDGQTNVDPVIRTDLARERAELPGCTKDARDSAELVLE